MNGIWKWSLWQCEDSNPGPLGLVSFVLTTRPRLFTHFNSNSSDDYKVPVVFLSNNLNKFNSVTFLSNRQKREMYFSCSITNKLHLKQKNVFFYFSAPFVHIHSTFWSWILKSTFLTMTLYRIFDTKKNPNEIALGLGFAWGHITVIHGCTQRGW